MINMNGQSNGPLSRIKVVEIGQLLAGPYAGQLLADMGADVIKVEDPKKGDPIRQWGRTLPQGQSLWWAVVGRNKRSVTADLRTSEGQEVLRRLLGDADVLIENFRPGTLERWGLGYEELKAINPRLVMTRVSGFGQDGPYANRPGYGSIGEAMGGLRYVVGDPSTPPSRVGISIGDTLAALFAAIGTLSAIIERQNSAEGQVVDSAIYEAVLAVMESVVPEWVISDHQRERSGAVLPNIAPSNAYETRDSAWVLIAANQDTVFARLAKAMGRSDLITDPKYSTHSARGENQVQLDSIVQNFTGKHSTNELVSLMEEFGVPFGRIYTVSDMMTDEHFRARESITTVEHPVFGDFPMQNVFPRLSRTAGTVRWAGRDLGADTATVLREVGYSDDEVTGLTSKGVV